MGIGEKLNMLLQKRDRNINELAIAINVSPQTLYSISKRNNTKVDLDILQKISDELSVTLDYFCSDSKIDEDALILSKEEKELIIAYRNNNEMQPAIKKMLDIDDEIIPVRIAAKGQGMREVAYTREQHKKALKALQELEDDE